MGQTCPKVVPFLRSFFKSLKNWCPKICLTSDNLYNHLHNILEYFRKLKKIVKILGATLLISSDAIFRKVPTQVLMLMRQVLMLES